MSTEEFEKYINYGVSGKFKSETKWYSLEEFVALRPKQYSYLVNGKNSKRAKGISKESTERYLTHEMYVDQVLKDQEVISCKMNNIQSKNFNLNAQYIYKKALVNYENKGYWLDSTYSLPFGHPLIKKVKKGEGEAVLKLLQGNDNYSYELNAYKIENFKSHERRIESERMIEDEEEEKKNRNKILSNISSSNLNDSHIQVIKNEMNIDKLDYNLMNDILSDPNGLELFKDLFKIEQ